MMAGGAECEKSKTDQGIVQWRRSVSNSRFLYLMIMHSWCIQRTIAFLVLAAGCRKKSQNRLVMK